MGFSEGVKTPAPISVEESALFCDDASSAFSLSGSSSIRDRDDDAFGSRIFLLGSPNGLTSDLSRLAAPRFSEGGETSFPECLAALQVPFES